MQKKRIKIRGARKRKLKNLSRSISSPETTKKMISDQNQPPKDGNSTDSFNTAAGAHLPPFKHLETPELGDTSNAAEKPLKQQIEALTRNLYYTSETDAPIEYFEATHSDSMRGSLAEKMRTAAGKTLDAQSFEAFFGNLTKQETWFDREAKENAEKFAELKRLLVENLADCTVFKSGGTEKDVYAVGIDEFGNIGGIKTSAVET